MPPVAAPGDEGVEERGRRRPGPGRGRRRSRAAPGARRPRGPPTVTGGRAVADGVVEQVDQDALAQHRVGAHQRQVGRRSMRTASASPRGTGSAASSAPGDDLLGGAPVEAGHQRAAPPAARGRAGWPRAARGARSRRTWRPAARAPRGASGSSASACAAVRMAVSGVRNSCETPCSSAVFSSSLRRRLSVSSAVCAMSGRARRRRPRGPPTASAKPGVRPARLLAGRPPGPPPAAPGRGRRRQGDGEALGATGAGGPRRCGRRRPPPAPRSRRQRVHAQGARRGGLHLRPGGARADLGQGRLGQVGEQLGVAPARLGLAPLAPEARRRGSW